MRECEDKSVRIEMSPSRYGIFSSGQVDLPGKDLDHAEADYLSE